MKEFQDFTFLYLKNITPCNLEKRQIHLAFFSPDSVVKEQEFYTILILRNKSAK